MRVLFVALCLLALDVAACSSSSSTESSKDATTDGAGCSGSPIECFCGSSACVGGEWVCPSCGGDTGSDAGGEASSFACGSSTCGPNQVCVHDCCGGPPSDGGSCTPPPPTCFDVPAACVGGVACGCLSVPTSQCQHCASVVGHDVQCGPCA